MTRSATVAGALLLDLAVERQAVHAGHLQVQESDVVGPLAHQLERRRPVVGEVDLVAQVGEDVAQVAADVRVVVHDEDPRIIAACHAAAPSQGVRCGQSDRERAAASRLAGHAEAPLILFHDRSRDCKPQPEPARLGRVQRLHDPGQVLRLDPAPVSITDTSTIAVDRAAPDGEPAPLRHRVARVADQVAEGDPELIAVAQDVGKLRGAARARPRSLRPAG